VDPAKQQMNVRVVRCMLPPARRGARGVEIFGLQARSALATSSGSSPAPLGGTL